MNLGELATALEELAATEGVEVVAGKLLAWIAAKTPQEKAAYLLDAQYAAVRAAVDAQAKRELG